MREEIKKMVVTKGALVLRRMWFTSLRLCVVYIYGANGSYSFVNDGHPLPRKCLLFEVGFFDMVL